MAGPDAIDPDAESSALRTRTIGVPRWHLFMRGIIAGVVTSIAAVIFVIVLPSLTGSRLGLPTPTVLPDVQAAVPSEDLVAVDGTELALPSPEYFQTPPEGPSASDQPLAPVAPSSPGQPSVLAGLPATLATTPESTAPEAVARPSNPDRPQPTELATQLNPSAGADNSDLVGAPEAARLPEKLSIAPNITITGLAPDLPGPAFEANAQPFDPRPDIPLLVIVLTDASAESLPPEALTMLRMPIVMAVPTDIEGAEDFAEDLFTAGFEVLAQLPLRGRVTPEELEQDTFNDLSSFDMAVGATGAADGRIVSNRDAMAAVLTPMAEYGFAFLDLQSGVSAAAAEIAAASGQPYVAANRVAVSGASEQQVFQVLEGAAIQAKRDGAVIVSISASASALRALLRWSIANGGTKAQFAPLSAVLRRSGE